eukprot:CAMPEP_0116142488 /NCGR_PEP_ID=MMETSP0329-20121206/14936_1 /TAXON_ID=697910 /ORGANISM="Pseudo-nitzschia arenysensis, Strain B593" /LENGTH=755 /DNA_ID=CAMNT_0003637729 /DNA_START=185 /DNA_END=2452 /DNA_ORIENTATION=+
MSNTTSIEVTANDYQRAVKGKRYVSSKEKNIANSYRKMTRRSWNLLSSNRKKKDSGSVCSKHSSSGFDNTSVANITVNSGTTLKASNLHEEQVEKKLALYSTLSENDLADSNACIESSGTKQQRPKNTQNKQPAPWKSLKRLVGKGRHNKHHFTPITPQTSNDSEPHTTQRRHAKSHDGAEAFSASKLPLDSDYPIRKRFHSDGVTGLSEQDSSDFLSSIDSQYAMDQVIQGRLDGIGVLSLGPASRMMSDETPSESNDHRGKNYKENDAFTSDPLHTYFVDVPPPIKQATIIDQMLWASNGMDQTEIIFEGFYPGCNDRWGVRISTLPVKRDSSKSATELINALLFSSDKTDSDASTATTVTDNDGSTSLQMAELWDSLWGVVATPPPIPSHMNLQTSNTSSPISNDDLDNYQQLLDTCNVPIDLDDDAFMIDCPQHVQSIHEVVMVPLQARQFDCAISILEKLQRGLDLRKHVHLVASTSHNIGLIQLCQGKYSEALDSFQTAIALRKECLPKDHPDIGVSLQREGMAHFAMGSIIEALLSFEVALEFCSSDSAQAKLLNCIGVARYHLKDYSQALKAFTTALEIQRPWLEGPVRRESIVHIASTILSNMGKVHLRQGDYDLAYLVFEEASLMQTSIFRLDHETVLTSMDNMGRAQSKQGNHMEALKIFTSLYRTQKEKLGADNKASIETLGMMGISHFKLLEYDEAEKCLKEVAEWQIEKGGMSSSDPLVKITNEQLEQIERCLQGTEPLWV